MKSILLLEPQYRDYVWGGDRLTGRKPVAEAWTVYEGDQVISGLPEQMTLGEAARRYQVELLGSRPVQKSGDRFPLLIKLLDCAQWLSLQVHPNNQQARQLEGENQFGKTEAWHFIDADPGSKILCGLRPGTTRAEMETAIRSGTILDHMQSIEVNRGDSIFIPPGMVHALGPGLLLYEVQQTSDITYRVWDWNRPASDNRPLHIDKSLAVVDTSLAGAVVPAAASENTGLSRLITCEYFTLNLASALDRPVEVELTGESFHCLTAVEGQVNVIGQGWGARLDQFASAVIPASAGSYRLESAAPFRALIASA